MKNIIKQILLGSIMGDGCLFINKGNKNINASFYCCHAESQKEYLYWKSAYIQKEFNGRFWNGPQKKRQNRYIFITRVYPYLSKLRKNIYTPKKSINKKILNSINELGLLVWFLDDGSYCYHRKSFVLCTDCFSITDQKEILNWLSKKFNIKGQLIRNGQHTRIRFNVNNSDKLRRLFLLIFIKYNIPYNMIYKIGEDFIKHIISDLKRKEYRNIFKNKNNAYNKLYSKTHKIDKIIRQKKI